MKLTPQILIVAVLSLAGCLKAPIDGQVERKGVGPGSGKPEKATTCNGPDSAKAFLLSQKDVFGDVHEDTVRFGCFGSQKDCLFSVSETSKDKFAHYSYTYARSKDSNEVLTTASIFVNKSAKCKVIGWGVNDLTEESETVSGCDLRGSIAKYEGVKSNHPRLKFMGSRLAYSIFGIKRSNVLSGDLPDSTIEVFNAFENEDGGSTLGLYFLDSKICRVIGAQRTNLDGEKSLSVDENSDL